MQEKFDTMWLEAKSVSLKSGQTSVLHEVSFQLKEGESLAITGSSGSGKTTLGRLLAGRVSPTHGNLAITPGLVRQMVDQQDHFMSLSGRRSTYHGQRYENQGMENTPSVRAYLQKVHEKSVKPTNGMEQVMTEMHIAHLADRKLLQLSNGERKRTQLAAALLQKPDVLVLDQPFVGLDTEARENLTHLLKQQISASILLVVICSPEHFPEGISKVVELHNGRITQFTDTKNYQPTIFEEDRKTIPQSAILSVLPPDNESFSAVVGMKNVNVTIGGKEILKGINWQVKSGEQWALLGHNGAGKTTLLSLVTADNPQGYVNDLVLFDRKRGSGESIWEIKRRIGYVSPELHLYFLRGEGIFNTIPGLSDKPHAHYDSLSCRDVVVSGFRDEIGFTSQPTDLQYDLAETWFSILQLDHLKNRLFLQASLGEQRSLLLARALVKSPSLLILDEPCQGLDPHQTRRFVSLLDEICAHLHTTLVYVTHLREEIPGCVKNLLLLENGQVKHCGSWEK
ncbi:MAG: ATP-binding cassette domain-containing protein [Mangrovibacterium sp.]